jgi:7-cyano-7-deazaguanine synthase
MKAVVLVSGGLDSTTVMGIVKSLGYDLHCLTFNYSQRNKIELELIKENIVNFNPLDHKIINVDLSFLNTSSLVNKNLDIQKYKNKSEITQDIPNTYVPARNTIFLSYALSYAENIGAKDIFIGIHKSDSPNYPDCTIEFALAFENLANIGTSFVNTKENDKKIKIHAPLINMTKTDIVRRGIELGLNYEKTISCYDPNEAGESCGKCISCLIRIDAFRNNNMDDPIKYIK